MFDATSNEKTTHKPLPESGSILICGLRSKALVSFQTKILTKFRLFLSFVLLEVMLVGACLEESVGQVIFLLSYSGKWDTRQHQNKCK